MSTTNISIVGATSDLAIAIARRYAPSGCRLTLFARGIDALGRVAQDLEVRGAKVDTHVLDLADPVAVDQASAIVARSDIVFYVAGVLDEDSSHMAANLDVNFRNAVVLLQPVAHAFAQRGHGTIVGISSVAGDRGRGSKPVYCASKAGFTAYLSGLRNWGFSRGVAVLTVIPGFLRTRMTAGLSTPDLLTLDPSQAAGQIVQAVDKGKDVVYVGPLWRWVMWIIRHIPERIFKRLSL